MSEQDDREAYNEARRQEANAYEEADPAPAASREGRASLHDRIMNLPCDTPDEYREMGDDGEPAYAYALGFRDARRASAELVALAESEGPATTMDEAPKPLCRCPPSVCILHPSLKTCGMRDRPAIVPAGFAVRHLRELDEAESLLAPSARPETATPETWWIGLNGQGQIVGAYRSKEQAHANTNYVVGIQPQGDRPETAGTPRPKVICLCGSTRFIEQFAVMTWVLEREGYIVLGCTLLPTWFCGVTSHFGEATGTKEQCDDLHKRKIDLADEILVLDYSGYIGDSTRSEITYAHATGKPVHYVSARPDLLRASSPSGAETTD